MWWHLLKMHCGNFKRLRSFSKRFHLKKIESYVNMLAGKNILFTYTKRLYLTAGGMAATIISSKLIVHRKSCEEQLGILSNKRKSSERFAQRYRCCCLRRSTYVAESSDQELTLIITLQKLWTTHNLYHKWWSRWKYLVERIVIYNIRFQSLCYGVWGMAYSTPYMVRNWQQSREMV